MRFFGVGLVMLAAICWGITGGIASILMKNGWDPVVISFYRATIGFVCFFIYFFYHIKEHWIVSVHLYKWSFLAGLGMAGNFVFYFMSIKSSSIPVAATLMYTAPLFVFLTSFFLGLERPTIFKSLCITGVLLGIVLLTGAYNMEKMAVTIVGASAGLASGLSYALFVFGFKKACLIGRIQSILAMAFFSLCIILLPFANLNEVFNVWSSRDIGYFLLLGILGAGISFIFYVIGIRWVAPTTAAVVAMVEPVTASLFGILVIGDSLSFIQLLGMILILFTVTLLAVKQSQ